MIITISRNLRRIQSSRPPHIISTAPLLPLLQNLLRRYQQITAIHISRHYAVRTVQHIRPFQRPYIIRRLRVSTHLLEISPLQRIHIQVIQPLGIPDSTIIIPVPHRHLRTKRIQSTRTVNIKLRLRIIHQPRSLRQVALYQLHDTLLRRPHRLIHIALLQNRLGNQRDIPPYLIQIEISIRTQKISLRQQMVTPVLSHHLTHTRNIINRIISHRHQLVPSIPVTRRQRRRKLVETNILIRIRTPRRTDKIIRPRLVPVQKTLLISILQWHITRIQCRPHIILRLPIYLRRYSIQRLYLQKIIQARRHQQNQ